MIKKERTIFRIFICCLFAFSFLQHAFSQVELSPWGNLAGIRIDGQLMEFESSLCVVRPGWTSMQATGKEKQRPKYTRAGDQQTVFTKIDSISFTEKVEDIDKGNGKITVDITTNKDERLQGIFFCLSLPSEFDAKATLQADNAKVISLLSDTATLNKYLGPATGKIRFAAASRRLELDFPQPVSLFIKKESDKTGSHLRLYVSMHTGDLQKGQTAQAGFLIRASGTVDNGPALIALHADQPGKPFDGFGGNFRLQNPAGDPQVIDYCLANLRVAWSRVEMPWRFWQPEKNTDPIADAKNGKLHPNVQHAMEMAQRLGKMGIPVILSAWSAPAWAIVGTPKFRPGPDGVWGNPLDTASMKEIYKSIADYVVYLKETYGVEVSMFSFNESDLGINIRQTGEEQLSLIKGLGAYFAERGLHTKLLLGDNSDATTYEFIYPALNDPAALPYIGAISFHSWRGWTKDILQKWADASVKINRPLLVGEGSIDAQAWGYPAVFEEQTYALQEISLYIKLLAICQPLSILQWQLTSDYSPLAGGGIFGNNGPLHPTQRFWNLKQLASTPKGLRAMPVSSNKESISAAALGDNAKGIYVLHLVNNGPSRTVKITGFPGSVKKMQVYITDQKRAMEEGTPIQVSNGIASFKLESGTYTTLRNQ